MKGDYTPLYVALGIGVATYLVFRLSKINPSVKFNDVVYDKIRNEIHLLVENKSDKTVYVKPALRLIKLTPAMEWKEKTSNGNGIKMMSAAKGSVIKGYELIGEYAEPVAVEPNTVRKIVYPVMRDFGLRAYDNIKVDSSYGTDPVNLESNTTCTVRMNLHDILKSEEYLEELSKLLDDAIAVENTDYNTSVSVPAQGPVDQISSSEVEAPAFAKPEGRVDVSKSDLPIQSMCVCCGKNRWLNWVVDEKHVCDDCKEYMSKGSEGNVPPDKVSSMEAADEEFHEIDTEPPMVDLFMSCDDSKLKPRYQRILELLDSEATLTAKDIAKRLSRKEKAVAADLRYLQSSNLIERVKIGRVFKYFSIRDTGKIIFSEPGAPGAGDEGGQILT